jgi:hypothetical protein
MGNWSRSPTVLRGEWKKKGETIQEDYSLKKFNWEGKERDKGISSNAEQRKVWVCF